MGWHRAVTGGLVVRTRPPAFAKILYLKYPKYPFLGTSEVPPGTSEVPVGTSEVPKYPRYFSRNGYFTKYRSTGGTSRVLRKYRPVLRKYRSTAGTSKAKRSLFEVPPVLRYFMKYRRYFRKYPRVLPQYPVLRYFIRYFKVPARVTKFWYICRCK